MFNRPFFNNILYHSSILDSLTNPADVAHLVPLSADTELFSLVVLQLATR